MKNSSLNVGDRVTLNFKRATENSTNQLFVDNVKQKIEEVKKLGTGYFLIDQFLDIGLVWVIAEGLDIGELCVKRKAIRKARKK